MTTIEPSSIGGALHDLTASNPRQDNASSIVTFFPKFLGTALCTRCPFGARPKRRTIAIFKSNLSTNCKHGVAVDQPGAAVDARLARWFGVTRTGMERFFLRGTPSCCSPRHNGDILPRRRAVSNMRSANFFKVRSGYSCNHCRTRSQEHDLVWQPLAALLLGKRLSNMAYYSNNFSTNDRLTSKNPAIGPYEPVPLSPVCKIFQRKSKE
jgi:hypothetical protein